MRVVWLMKISHLIIPCFVVFSTVFRVHFSKLLRFSIPYLSLQGVLAVVAIFSPCGASASVRPVYDKCVSEGPLNCKQIAARDILESRSVMNIVRSVIVSSLCKLFERAAIHILECTPRQD